MCSAADFDIGEGKQMDFVLGWSPSFNDIPPALDVAEALQETADGWSEWAARFTGAGEWSDIVLRSLITLKALTHFATGGIVAAATTSLPESLGGARNWDYRYCWLRDSTMTLHALIEGGLAGLAVACHCRQPRAIADHVRYRR